MAITLTNLGNEGPGITKKLHARCFINDHRLKVGTFIYSPNLQLISYWPYFLTSEPPLP